MNDKAISKTMFRLQPNLFLTSIISKIMKEDEEPSIDPYFIQYIIDRFRYVFDKTLDAEDIKSIKELIKLLESIKDLNITENIEELKNNPKNRQIQGKLKLAFGNKKRDIYSICKIIKKKSYLSGFVNPIYEISHRFIAEDINNAVEEQPYFSSIYYLKKVYKMEGKFTLTKPDKQNSKIYFNSPEEDYQEAINGLKKYDSKTSLKLMPLNFIEIKPKRISNLEHNTDLGKFIRFLGFYLRSLEKVEKDIDYYNYYIFIILMISPFADYVANNKKYSKKILEYCMKKVGFSEETKKLILTYFNINYNGQSIEDNDIRDKPSKGFYAFFKYYLKDNKRLKKEYDEFKNKFDEEEKEHYIKEIEKFNHKMPCDAD